MKSLDLINMRVDEKLDYVIRGTVQILKKEELLSKLKKSEEDNRSLVIKYGVDPTAPEIHLGHVVPLKTLRRFQDIGNDITFLIGDFTARIGDPSGKNSGRKPMSEEEVMYNSERYKDQIFKVLNPERTKIVYNSSWLKPLNLENVIELLSKSTVNKLVKRNSFVKRFENGNAISGHELIYPYLQAFDSVALNSDVEIGGTDQYFNLIFGRDLQPKYGQQPQVVLTTQILEGLDGNEKMSKSLGNTVGICESAFDMYSKIMRIRDDLVTKYFKLLTDVSLYELSDMQLRIEKGAFHPLDFKKKLATEITQQFHSVYDTKRAENEYIKINEKGAIPREISEYIIDHEMTKEGSLSGIDLLTLTGLVSSNSEARRLINQRGFSIDSIVVDDFSKNIKIEDGMLLRVGKKKYLKLKYNN